MNARKLVLVLPLALCFATSAHAKIWAVDYAQSRLSFTGKQSGVAFDGKFKSFTATIDFDPARPETGKITANIDIAGAATGDAERDSSLPQSDWFDVKKFPTAQFATTTIKSAAADKAGDTCFVADGTLTLKSITKPVSLPFCLIPEGDHMRAKGQLTLSRSDYNVGTGQWAGEETVAHAVIVTVDIAAK